MTRRSAAGRQPGGGKYRKSDDRTRAERPESAGCAARSWPVRTRGSATNSGRHFAVSPFTGGGDEVTEFGSGRGRASAKMESSASEGEANLVVPQIFDPGSRTAEKAGSAPPSRPTAELERFYAERYDHIAENPFVPVAEDPRSTFSVDVDTAAYALTRRHLREGRRPPPGAVRIEELVNYFSYNYPEPRSGEPFSVTTELSNAPWAPKHHLLRIGIKGKHVAPAARPSANLVFQVDVSSSMNAGGDSLRQELVELAHLAQGLSR